MKWMDVKIIIPRLPPSELRNCGIIDVQYFVFVSAHRPVTRGEALIRPGHSPKFKEAKLIFQDIHVYIFVTLKIFLAYMSAFCL